MSTGDTIQFLRALNPAPTDPTAPPVGALIERLDLSVRGLDDTFPPPLTRRARSGSSMVPRVAAGAAVAAGLAIGVVVITGGSGTSGVSVAAAVDQAITPGPGVLHMLIESENTIGGEVTTSTHEEIWTAQSPRRQRVVSTLKAGGETVEDEGVVLSASPPRTLTWSRSDPNVIRENTSPIDQSVQTPVSWLQTAYQAGRLKVLGQDELNGRSVWRLSVARDPSQPAPMLNGQPVPSPIVVVDAHSFVPLENVIYSAGSHDGHPALETTRVQYLTYQELPANAADESLLKPVSHPGAKVITEPAAPASSEH